MITAYLLVPRRDAGYNHPLSASVFPFGKYTTQSHSHPQMPNKKEDSLMILAQIDFLLDLLIAYCIRVH